MSESSSDSSIAVMSRGYARRDRSSDARMCAHVEQNDRDHDAFYHLSHSVILSTL